MATKPKRYKPKSDPKNAFRDIKRLPFTGETNEISRSRTAFKPFSKYDSLEVSKPYNNFVLRKSQDRAVTKAKKSIATKAADRLKSPPTKRLSINMGKAPASASMKFADDVGIRALGKVAGRVASKALAPLAAAQAAFEVGDSLKDTPLALKMRRGLSDTAAEFTGLAKRERDAMDPIKDVNASIRGRARRTFAKGGSIDGCASKGKTKGKYI